VSSDSVSGAGPRWGRCRPPGSARCPRTAARAGGATRRWSCRTLPRPGSAPSRAAEARPPPAGWIQSTSTATPAARAGRAAVGADAAAPAPPLPPPTTVRARVRAARPARKLALLEPTRFRCSTSFELAIAQIDFVLLAFCDPKKTSASGAVRQSRMVRPEPGGRCLEQDVALAAVRVAELHMCGVRCRSGQESPGARGDVELLFEPRHGEPVYFTPRYT